MATPMFIEEYGLRPNRLFVEYLVYPKEVFSMLMSGHSAAVFVTLVLLAAAIKLIVLPLANYFVFKTSRYSKDYTRRDFTCARCTYTTCPWHIWTPTYQSCVCVFFK